ncbi:MAG: hypothetical protein ABFD89_00710 [Bryobacteraceae bacterium]
MKLLLSLPSVFLLVGIAVLCLPPESSLIVVGWLADVAVTFALFAFALVMAARRNRRLMKGWR